LNRRLNPQLFEDNSPAPAEEAPTYSAVAAQKMGEEFKEIKKSVSHLESVVEVLQAQVGQLSKNSDKRSEVFSTALNEIEKAMAEQTDQLSQKSQRLEEQLKDREQVDTKIENMVDRFNMSLQQFENKLSSLQKVISEKEMALMSYRKIIEQIVDEVEKLKASR
jgi:chromosome segregation ATPase